MMIHNSSRPAWGGILLMVLALTLGAYFTFAAVQGEFGVFRRVQILAEAGALRTERDDLKQQLALMQNLTHRLSDGYLDIDLLDQQARDVLGYMRADEMMIR